MNKNQNRNIDNDSKEVIETSLGTKIAYGNGVLADNLAIQNFSYLGFSFYFAVVGLTVQFFSACYILWSICYAINDPVLGILSDRT
jgi:Na+/melibiose symporter-like transporter